jgi:ADP-heptose:LPS heptosyltransferase
VIDERRFLVFRPGALGDTILTVDALHALRTRFPDAAVELIGNPSAGAVLLAAGLVARATSFDGAEVMGLYTAPATVPARWAAAIGAVLWLVRAEAIAHSLEQVGVARVLAADPPFPGSRMHAADHLTATLAPLGVAPLCSVGSLALPEGVSQHSSGAVERSVIVHPGSGAAAKNWAADRYATLIRGLKEEGWSVSLLSGPADAQSVTDVITKLGPHAPAVIAPADVMDLARSLSRATLFIGNDSGVSHLSARIGVPTVAIFGPTDPRQWAPRGPLVRVAATIPWPEPDEVREEMALLLQAMPRSS